jgi:hypothetical protein
MIGAPVDLIAAGLNKASNKIIGKDIVPDDSFGGSKSIQEGLSALPSVEVVDENHRQPQVMLVKLLLKLLHFSFLPLRLHKCCRKHNQRQREVRFFSASLINS